MPRPLIRLLPLAACCALAALAGCGDSHGADPLVEVTGSKATGMATPISGKDFVPEAGQDFATAIGGHDPIGVDKEAIGRDKVQKADVYWKLRWMVDALRDGTAPRDMDAKMSETRKQLEASLQDEYKQPLVDVMDSLDEAFEAYKSEAEFTQQGLDTHTVAWGTGRVAMEGGLSADSLPSLDHDMPGAAPLKVPQDNSKLLDFEAKYHTSPRMTRLSALNRADLNLEATADRIDRARTIAGEHTLGRDAKQGHGFGNAVPGGMQVKPLPGQTVLGESVPIK